MTAYAATDQIAEIVGLQAALDAKAIDTAVVHKTGAETIGGAKTYTSTVTTSVSHATSATVARWVNPLATNGDYSLVIGGAGNFDGQIQCIHAVSGRLFNITTAGLSFPANKTISVDTNGGMTYVQNANTAATVDAEGFNIRGLNRVLVWVGGSIRAFFAAASAYLTTPFYVGSTAAGSANAQLESRAKDATTPIFAGYDSSGILRWLIGSKGRITTPGRDGPITANTDAATVTFDLAASDQHTLTLNVAGATRTLALTNESTGSQQFTLYLTQDATAGRSVVWWSGIKWTNGTPPTLSATGGALDVVTIRRLGSGSYCGFHAGPNMS